MKKFIILSICFCSIFCTLFAQKNKNKKKKIIAEYGILSGININSIETNTQNVFLKENFTNFTGISVGGYFKINIHKQIGIKVLAQYDQNGYKLDKLSFTDPVGNDLGPGSATIRNTYLNIPIVGEYTFGNKIKYYINAGPYFGFLLSSNVVTKISSTPTTQGSTSKTTSDSYKNSNLGVSFGAGSLIPISKYLQLHVAVKNNVGLSNIIKPIPLDDSPFKTNAFSILAGINFSL